VSTAVAERFVDAVVQDSWLVNPTELLAAMRAPAGRNPADSSRRIAQALSALDDDEALSIIRAALDAAYFSIFSLFDADMKNSGLGVKIGSESGYWTSGEFAIPLHEIYRDRVEPNGSVRKPS
jgi:hypothetical protein